MPLLAVACGGLTGCRDRSPLELEVYETSARGHQLTRVSGFVQHPDAVTLRVLPEQTYQTITGFGGSFTEASATLLNRLGAENRRRILEAYFGDDGARYSLTRTHMNSCDFSLGHYSYAPLAGDTELTSFSIAEDLDDIVPMIKGALAISTDGFKIIASPWTAPPWMKDNDDWRGGKLLPEYRDTWARFFARYADAYRAEGIDIWAFTVENEPLGNDGNWESMHFTPAEQNAFVIDHLGPTLEASGNGHIKILGYDQNREHLPEWVDEMYKDERSSRFYAGTAIHWYASTYEVFADELQDAHRKAPDKLLIQTEACVDSEVPRWRDDAWYWSQEATDWGWDWAPADRKRYHPKYVPVYRYARDIIGCLNNWVDGWVDWNMVLDRQGGPNWFENWCVAPVIVDPEQDEVYFTPLYFTMSHFSRFIRPGAERIGLELADGSLLATAARNEDGSVVVVLLNQGARARSIDLHLAQRQANLSIDGQAVQTLIIRP
ncbi:MAG: glycoside hydrolase family 30 protein [Candidatus Krumholzibacteriia bacterium]